MGDRSRGLGDNAGSLLESGSERTWSIWAGMSQFDPHATLAPSPKFFRRIGPGRLPDVEIGQLHCRAQYADYVAAFRQG
jgi:hypothetical protein